MGRFISYIAFIKTLGIHVNYNNIYSTFSFMIACSFCLFPRWFVEGKLSCMCMPDRTGSQRDVVILKHNAYTIYYVWKSFDTEQNSGTWLLQILDTI